MFWRIPKKNIPFLLIWENSKTVKLLQSKDNTNFWFFETLNCNKYQIKLKLSCTRQRDEQNIDYTEY